jgi:MFS family permease
MIFVVASFCNFLGPLLLGIVLDTYGPRACSVLSIGLIMIGSAMFAVSEPNTMPLFVPGMCLIAFGGPGTQNAIIHLSNLYPGWKATATAFITGSFQMSFVVFLIFDQLWMNWNLTYTELFAGYCVVCFINVVISLLLWPDEPFQSSYGVEEDEEDEEEEEEEVSEGKELITTAGQSESDKVHPMHHHHHHRQHQHQEQNEPVVRVVYLPCMLLPSGVVVFYTATSYFIPFLIVFVVVFEFVVGAKL